MKRKKGRGGAGRWIGRGIWTLVVLYLLAVVLPYAFPPDANQAALPPSLSSPAAFPGGERAAILETGEEALWGRLYLIESARERLRMTSYLYACDESGEKIGAALLRAAQRGVRVEILVDGLIGAINFGGKALPYALGGHENVEIRYYNPLNLLAPAGINARLHEKYLVADDHALILGGRNISDEFLTAADHPAYNDDRDVMLWADAPGPGTGVSQLTEYFDALWNSGFTAPCFETGGGADAVERARAEMAARLEETEKDRDRWFSQIDDGDFFVPVDGAVLLHNPIHPGVKEPLLLQAFCGLMAEGKTRVWLQSPYFVLNGAMQTALSAVADAPSQLRLYTNSFGSGNNIVASADYLWQKGRVTALAGDLYESQSVYSSHTKSALVDDVLSIFGSFNFDMRSAYIDTEVMLAVYGEELNARLAECMARVEAVSLRVTAAGYAEKENPAPREPDFFKRAVIYLLSPFTFLVRYLL